MANGWAWQEMLDEFRALGGVAENICQKESPLGRGLFPVDPTAPYSLRTPPNLLIENKLITFDGETLRIAPDAEVGARERGFFERYQAAFSWGAGVRKDCIALIETMNALPDPVRALLASEFGLAAFFGGDVVARAQTHFLSSRQIGYHGKLVLMPVIELVNHHTDGAVFAYKDGISISGIASGEIFAKYQNTDPFGFFLSWGFASPEPMALSLPIALAVGQRKLVVHRNFHSKNSYQTVKMPTARIEGDNIVVSHLMLGNAQYPKLSKGVFYKLMENLELANSEELFDQIAHFNRMQFLKLGAVLDQYEGPGIALLRKMCNFQLTALSHSVGARKL